MFTTDRRSFLGSAAGGLAALFAAPAVLLGEQPLVSAPATFKPDTLFLTWHTDPTTTMVVQWVSDAPDDSGPVVYYGPATISGWSVKTVTTRPFPLSPGLTVFRCELTGLTPGTDYRFCIGLDSPVYKFRTMPAKLTNEFTFVSGGDCGVNEHVVNNNKVAAKQDPHFVVIGGDVAYDNGTDAKAVLGWLKNYSSTMTDSKGRLVPVVACLGNHEVAGGGYGKTRKEAPFFFALFDGLFADATYTALDFGDYLSLLLLDTGHVSKIEGEQTSWLNLALKNRAEMPHLIAVQHVPCYPSFRAAEGTGGKAGTGDSQRKHWVPLYEKHQVDLVLEHHDHTFKRTHPLLNGHADKRGVMYLGDGSWGRIRPPAPPEKREYLAAASMSYHFTVHRIQGDDRFHMAVDELGKIVDVCHTAKKRGLT